jgi:hypothetical protein
MSEPKAIPKFGSFKPKATPRPPVEKEKKHSSKDKEKDGPNEKENQRPHQHRHRHRHRSKSRERHGHVAEPRPSQPPPPAREKSPDIFFVDRKGDEKNLTYGSIHRYDVPAFYRVGAGGVLGAPSNLKINRDHGNDKEIVLHDWKNSKFSSREKYVFSRVERDKPQLLKIRSELPAQSVKDLDVDFVSLNPARGQKRKRVGTHGESSDSDNDETHYRSIHGKSRGKSQPTDEALQYATDSESGSEAGIKLGSDAPERQKNIELNRRVEQHPQDIDAWLALIVHQDALLRGQDDHRRVTNAEMRSTAEIKVHMYEKALEKATSLKDRERLLLGLMAEGSKIWDRRVQSERWEQISKNHIDSLMLWTSYLDFKQASFSTFQYEDARDIYISRIKLLSKIASTASSETINFIYQQLLYVLLRLTLFMRESGFSELAVAIWQGVLEINFWAPKQSLSKEDSIRQFSGFWESEVARIGDKGARGWHHFAENQNEPEAEALTATVGHALDNVNLFQNWANSERLRSKDSLLPARTMDDVAEDDPFRVILFADIEEFLIMLPPSSEGLRKSLLDAFLLFCRLPPISALYHHEQDDVRDASARDELLDCNSAWICDVYGQKLTVERAGFDISSALDIPVSAYQSSPETLFTSNVWFKNINVWRERYAGDSGPVSYKWVRNVLKQLTQATLREYLAEYYLAFEWRNEPDTVKKSSKTLIKQHPSSLRLYNAYAMIEKARGNKDVANGVFSAALNMSRSMPENEERDSILLWKSWVWASLEDLDKYSALQHLLSIADGAVDAPVGLSPTALLKTKQHLESNRDYLISAGAAQYAVMYGECLALLEYLTPNSSKETQSATQGDIASALVSYTALSKTFVDRNLKNGPSHELLLQSAARLLYHHAQSGPFRPALLREHLTNFISLFPQNTIFLSLYTWNESRLRIDNRVRNILLSTVLTPENDTLRSRLFAIYYEINYGTIHSARSTFEHAVSSPKTKSAAGLWKFYILYCLETPQFRSQAKDIWYRALRACPWAKELYIIGFEKLGDLVSFEELKRTWRVMSEKELRVHVDLEDNFEEIAELEQKSGAHKRVGFR